MPAQLLHELEMRQNPHRACCGLFSVGAGRHIPASSIEALANLSSLAWTPPCFVSTIANPGSQQLSAVRNSRMCDIRDPITELPLQAYPAWDGQKASNAQWCQGIHPWSTLHGQFCAIPNAFKAESGHERPPHQNPTRPK